MASCVSSDTQNRRKFARSVLLCEAQAVAAIGLELVARPLRDQGRRNDFTVMACV